MSRLRSPIALLAIVLCAKTFAGHLAAVWYGYDYWVLPVVIAAVCLFLTIILFVGDSFLGVPQMPDHPKGVRIDLWRQKLQSTPQTEMAYTPEWVHYLTLACIGIGALSLLSLITIPVLRLALDFLPAGMQVASR